MPRYFAYCTLLDTDEMHKFCPHAESTIVASESGYRVTFARYDSSGPGGGCNLQEAPGHRIYGLVYELSDDEFDQLDRISGVDRGYYRRVELQLRGADGEMMNAWTYVMPNPGDAFRPSASYVQPILAGAEASNLPADYRAELREIVRVATGDA